MSFLNLNPVIRVMPEWQTHGVTIATSTREQNRRARGEFPLPPMLLNDSSILDSAALVPTAADSVVVPYLPR